jgi:hypothetical protein
VFAVLDFSDYFFIALIVGCLGGTAAANLFRPSDRAQLRRIEAKLNLVLEHLGVQYQDPTTQGLSPEVKTLADDPARKIAAIKLHREQTGLGLKEAKEAVETYIAGRV